jgi:hypothetical protein
MAVERLARPDHSNHPFKIHSSQYPGIQTLYDGDHLSNVNVVFSYRKLSIPSESLPSIATTFRTSYLLKILFLRCSNAGEGTHTWLQVWV